MLVVTQPLKPEHPSERNRETGETLIKMPRSTALYTRGGRELETFVAIIGLFFDLFTAEAFNWIIFLILFPVFHLSS